MLISPSFVVAASVAGFEEAIKRQDWGAAPTFDASPGGSGHRRGSCRALLRPTSIEDVPERVECEKVARVLAGIPFGDLGRMEGTEEVAIP